MTESLCFRQPFKGLYILQRALSTLLSGSVLDDQVLSCFNSATTNVDSERDGVLALRRMMRINEATGIVLALGDKLCLTTSHRRSSSQWNDKERDGQAQ